MRYINKFNEARESRTKEQEIIDDFEKAYKTGSTSFNQEYYGSTWSKMRSEWHLYDNYYLYRDAIFSVVTRPSGDWYHTELVKLKEEPHVFKEKIFKKIEQLEKAFDKL